MAKASPSKGTSTLVLVYLMIASVVIPNAALAQDATWEPTLTIATYSFPGGGRQDLNLTRWYDTGHFVAEMTQCAPEGFLVTGARDDYGPLAFSPDPEAPHCVMLTTHYSNNGYRSVSVFAHNEDGQQIAPGIFFADASALPTVSAGSETLLVLHAPEEGRVLLPNGTQWRVWSERGSQPLSQRYIVVHPEARDAYTLTPTDRYSLFAPSSLDAQAIERMTLIAKAAESTLPDLEALVGIGDRTQRQLVIFALDSMFEWEDGWQSGGLIAVRTSYVDEGVEGWLLDGARLLVHETMHALLEESFAWWFGHSAWLNEGSARYAEHLFEARHPELVTHCETDIGCSNLSARIDWADLEEFYRGGTRFDPSWTPHDEQSEEDRRLRYSYSGYLVGAYLREYGEDAYRRALASLSAMEPDRTRRDCPECEAAVIEGALLNAAGASAAHAQLYQPWNREYKASPDEFRDRVADLVVMKRWTPDPATAGSGTSGPSEPEAAPSELERAEREKDEDGTGEAVSHVAAVTEAQPPPAESQVDEAAAPQRNTPTPGGPEGDAPAVTEQRRPPGFDGAVLSGAQVLVQESPFAPLAFAIALATPLFIYHRVVVHPRRLPRAPPDHARLRASAHLFGAGDAAFWHTQMSARDGPSGVMLATRLHKSLVPRGTGSAWLIGLVLFAPFLALPYVQPAIWAAAAWSGIGTAWVILVVVESARHPRVVWRFEPAAARLQALGRFGRVQEEWSSPAHAIEAVVVRPMRLADGDTVWYEVDLVGRDDDRRVAVFEKLNDALGVGLIIARMYGGALHELEEGALSLPPSSVAQPGAM